MLYYQVGRIGQFCAVAKSIKIFPGTAFASQTRQRRGFHPFNTRANGQESVPTPKISGFRPSNELLCDSKPIRAYISAGLLRRTCLLGIRIGKKQPSHFCKLVAADKHKLLFIFYFHISAATTSHFVQSFAKCQARYFFQKNRGCSIYERQKSR